MKMDLITNTEFENKLRDKNGNALKLPEKTIFQFQGTETEIVYYCNQTEDRIIEFYKKISDSFEEIDKTNFQIKYIQTLYNIHLYKLDGWNGNQIYITLLE